MKQVSLALIGLGNVGKALARLLLRKQVQLEKDYGFTFKVTGIATARHGVAIDPVGLDLEVVLKHLEKGGSLADLTRRPVESILEFVQVVPADVLFENSPVNYETGQPAITYLRTAIERGMHAITANKGPVVHGLFELSKLAEQRNRHFFYESSVMDGAPIFSLFRNALPASELKSFFGILNSSTNYILGLMEQENTYDEAVRKAQEIGMAETDPSGDVDGFDAAIKVAALVTALMGIPFKPQDVDRQGIRSITPAMIADAKNQTKRWKLVCRAERDGNKVKAKVAPEMVGPESALFAVNGTSSFAQFAMDTLPGLGIVENNPSPDTTAYGLLADLIAAVT